MDRAACGNGIGQTRAIPDGAAIDEDRHVPPQGGLVVKHVGSRLGIGGEHVVQYFPHAAAPGLGLRALNVPLNVLGEDDPCHASHSD
jgi:hypothetical protein